MKKSFVILRAITACLAGMAFTFKSCHWPGGTVMMFCAAVLIAVVAIMGAIEYPKIRRIGKGVSIFSALTVIVCTFGFVFWMMYWPGGAILRILGFGIMLPISAILSALSYTKHNK